MNVNELDIAYDYLKNVTKEQASFQHIWAYVVEKSGMSIEESESRVSKFFTNFMLDGRFVTIGENIWDLRERQTFDKVHIDMKDVYNDVDTFDEDSEEEEEEYESIFAEKEESDEEGEEERDEDEEDSEESDSEFEDELDFNI
ncbi:MAG: DNA-directed RNA polymerase subunit delta [Coprobacillus sp.]|nr:DNA-directed RNA polymerase subunit delta [Coprobacillus sp.]